MKTLYRGRSKWLRVSDDYEPKGGENVIETDNVEKQVGGDFELTYSMYLYDLFDQLPGKKYTVLKYILEHKSSDNTLIVTNRELSEKCNVAIKTIVETLKILRNAHLIETRTGSIKLNLPHCKGGKEGKKRYLLLKFAEEEK